MSETPINDVSDTALWVAVYRARETERKDALFHDPFARKLAGAKGFEIADKMSYSKHVAFSVVFRTIIIDDYIYDLVKKGVDTVINLGAGLDARPYRMDLPANLRWIEVDYPHMIHLKHERLAADKPKCKLERVAIDLGNDEARRDFFLKVAIQSKNVVVLTEGVTPYLTEAQVGALADDLRCHKCFKHWILDYMNPLIYKYVLTERRKRDMKNAPFVFLPKDWFAFFDQHGWKVTTRRYNAEEAVKLGRPLPFPWWAKMMMLIFKPRPIQLQYNGYFIIEPK